MHSIFGLFQAVFLRSFPLFFLFNDVFRNIKIGDARNSRFSISLVYLVFSFVVVINTSFWYFTFISIILSVALIGRDSYCSPLVLRAS